MPTKLVWTMGCVLGCSVAAHGSPQDPTDCPHDNPWPYFSHDTLGYGSNLAPNAKGPSNPCQVMKAVTEGAADSTTYIGARIGFDKNYPPAGVEHAGTVTVAYSYFDHAFENNATEGSDFTSWWRDCDLTLQPSVNSTFLIPFPHTGCSNTCAGAGAAILQLVNDNDYWEPPELVRMEMVGVTTTVAGANGFVPDDYYIAGWIIQDTCESGALFKYPSSLPYPDSQIGLTVQLTTSLQAGYFRFFDGVKMEDHVAQSFPFAASEVVAETSWLEFTIALLDENAVTQRANQPNYGIEGNLVPAPANIDVTYRFLGELDWDEDQAGCGELPINWPNSYPYYATQGPAPHDFIIQRHDPAQFDPYDADFGWVDVPPNPFGVSTVTIHTGESHVSMRILVNNSGGATTPTRIAHMRVLDASFPVPPPPYDATIPIGWSSDFRFLIQEESKCPK